MAPSLVWLPSQILTFFFIFIFDVHFFYYIFMQFPLSLSVALNTKGKSFTLLCSLDFFSPPPYRSNQRYKCIIIIVKYELLYLLTYMCTIGDSAKFDT